MNGCSLVMKLSAVRRPELYLFLALSTFFFSLLLFSAASALQHVDLLDGVQQHYSSSVDGTEKADTHHDLHIDGPTHERRQWEERFFNVGAHEVPSGPNPISN